MKKMIVHDKHFVLPNKVSQGQRIRLKKEKGGTKPVMGQLMSCRTTSVQRTPLSQTVEYTRPQYCTSQEVST